jgi:hypothetical protein
MLELPFENLNDSTSIEDIIAYRHWHAESEAYAGGDSLATALFLGWTSSDTVHLEEHWYAGTRRVAVYYFELMRDTEKITMPVIGNPYVDRLIATMTLQVIPVGKFQRPKAHVDAESRV